MAVKRLGLSLALITAYAFAVLWINRIDADQPLTFRFVLARDRTRPARPARRVARPT